MSAETDASAYGDGIEQTLCSRIHDIEPLLALEGEWLMLDAREQIGDADIHLRADLAKQVVDELRATGAVKIADTDADNDHRHIYCWDVEHKRALKHYADNLSTLPCGHRAHIPSDASAGDDVLSCKFCGADHSRETFKEAL